VFIARELPPSPRSPAGKRCRGDEPDLGRKTEILDVCNDDIRNHGVRNDGFAKTVLATTVVSPKYRPTSLLPLSQPAAQNSEQGAAAYIAAYIKEVHSEWVLSIDSANTKRLP
jgi:hypothetical protein